MTNDTRLKFIGKVMSGAGVYSLFPAFSLYSGNPNGIERSLKSEKKEYMIRHTVAFKLIGNISKTEEEKFFTEIKKLLTIKGVKKFEPLIQVSKKNNFSYGLSMEFDSAEAYSNYSNHPLHNTFVENYWVKYVEDFMELDYEPMG